MALPIALWPGDDDDLLAEPFRRALSSEARDAAEIARRARIVRAAVPEPLANQVPIATSPARFKVLRCGRRFGKTRFALTVAFRGHGPVVHDRNGVAGPKFRGIAQGMDVVWVAQDYPNLTTIVWKEEFEPRFRPLDFATLNRQDHTITLDGLGTLFCRPETAIAGIRGIGKRLGGVIIDEAAWLDLEHAMQDVIMAALIDNEGWLILMSTTNAGQDGNREKRAPSYFNLICQQIKSGERSEDWQEFYGTAFDNPTLKASAIQDLINEYPAGSPSLEQEVYAKLITGGVGMALEELTERVHVVPPFPIPSHWEQFGAFDWGYRHPWVFCWFASDEDGNLVVVDSVTGRLDTPWQIAEKIRGVVPVQQLRYIHAGHDCWNMHRAMGENTPTIAETFQAQGLILTRANNDRRQGLNNLREYIDWRGTLLMPDGSRVDGDPGLRFFDTPTNRWGVKQMQRIPIDPADVEKPLKVDADPVTGAGGDDYFETVRYGAASRPRRARSTFAEQDVKAWSRETLAFEREQLMRVQSATPKKGQQAQRRRGFIPPGSAF